MSFIEGGALMAVELIGARIVAPTFGSSLYVWSVVLAASVGGLTVGYALGGRVSARHARPAVLAAIVAASALLVGLLPLVAPIVLHATLGLDLRAGILLACTVLLLPSLIAFGTVSPLVIRLVSSDLARLGHAAGTVYGLSTVGGIVATFAFGFYLIPFLGLRASCLATAAALAAAAVLAAATPSTEARR